MKGVPLLTFISRLDPQKGLDIALQGLEQCQSQPWQVIILGTGDSIVEDLACEFERKYPQRVRTFIEFNNQLAHQLYAGADILLMPSRYEPCGLAQMIAMRYGCVPIAHSTGGLLDTIISVVKDPNLGAGFLFEEDTPSQFSSSLKLAIKCYQEPQKWQQIQHNGMKTDFSWRKSALKYIHEYQALVNTSA
jgi:starch synthase